MSLFSNNIESEIPIISRGKKWMTTNIKDVVGRYIDREFTQVIERQESPTYDSDKREMTALKQEIIWNWMNHYYLEQFNISATDTVINPSTVSGYKYEVEVNVRFIGDPNMDNYVPFVRVPIITDFERSLYDPSSRKKYYERVELYKPRII